MNRRSSTTLVLALIGVLTAIAVPAAGAATAPSQPQGFVVTSSTASSIATAWQPAPAGSGVTRYKLFVNGAPVARVPASQHSYRFDGLACGTVYRLAVAAKDAAGRRSSLATLSAGTQACAMSAADTQPPSQPGGFASGSATANSIATSWSASSDDVGVVAYDLYRDGVQVGTTQATNATFSGLACGSSYTLAVSARDAAGNRSPRAALTASTAPCGTAPAAAGSPCGSSTQAPATYQHVIWIWLENHSYSSVLGGNSSAPYFNQLADACGYSTQWMDNLFSFNSEPEYEAAVSGSNCDSGFGSNGSNCNTGNDGAPSSSVILHTKTLFDQVSAAGGSWKAYQEEMPSNCAFSSSGKYAPKHNPPVFFASLTGGSNTAPAAGSPCAQNDVPLPALSCSATANTPCSGTPSGALANDLASGHLPTFSFVTPNLCNDMHDCSPTVSDNWLHAWLPRIFASSAYQSGQTAMFVMWDEGSFGSPQPNIVISPSTDHVMSTVTMNNLAALRATESMLGLGYLGCAGGTPPGNVGSCPPGSTADLRSIFHL